MNEEPPPPFDTVGDAPVEARIVAWVLGETSAFEAAELERLCEERPELLVFRRRMRALHGLLTEAEAAEKDHSWKLPVEKRQVLDEIFGEEKVYRLDPQKERRIRRASFRAFFAIAACLALAVVVLQLIHPIWITQGPLRSAEKKVDFMPPSGGGGNSELALHELNKAVRDQEDKVEERRKVLATITRTKGIIYKGQDSFYGQSGVDEEVMKNDSREEAIKRGLDAQDYVDAKRDFESDQQLLQAMKLKQIELSIAKNGRDESLARNDAPAPVTAPSTPPSDGSYRLESKQAQSNRELGMQKTKEQSMLAKSPAKTASRVAASAAPAQPQLPPPTESSLMDQLPAIAASGVGEAEGLGAGAKWGSDALTRDRDVPPAPVVAPQGEVFFSSAAESVKRNNIDAILNHPSQPGPDSKAKGDKGESVRKPRVFAGKVESIRSSEADEEPIRTGAAKIKITREFQYPTEDEPPAPANEPLPAEEAELLADLANEIPAAENPYSTFSLNISDASFQLAKAALAKGERPDPASIKPEQFYNAVDYGDPAPASNEPVAATVEQSAHPVIPGRNLVRVALRTGSVGRSAVQPLRLTLLVDQSGSMVREDRRASMEHALAQLSVLLTKADLVTVIGFSRTPHLLADAMTGDQAVKLAELINQTASEGGTNLEEALKLGGQLAERHQLAGAQNRIVLLTDGAANLGDANPARLAEQVKSFRQKGLAFDIAGIGADGLNDRLLSELARNGNGRYYVVGDEKNDSFARQLAGAFRPAAENVKVQVNFNPQRVGKYKLIGFEKDRLKTEDFRNDAVDAAELAAEEAGVAIYQVEPLADGTGEIGEVSVRFRDAVSKEMVERTWTIPYESQATAFDRATPSMQLAGLSLLAAEKLRGGPLADAIDFKQLTGSSTFVKQFYGSSPRVSEMLRVIDALK